MSASSSNRVPVRGKDVVIIGDGPAAFIAAIKLKQKNVRNVTIVGPRLGEFTRSGDYRDALFGEVSAAIAPLKITPSPGRHIKDVERELYRHAQALGISLVKKQFEDFAAEHHLVLTEGNQRSLIHADIVFDCTGTKRAVIKKYNDRAGAGPRFTITATGDVPYKSFALVRVSMSAAEMKRLDDFYYERMVLNPVSHALALEELRKAGWKGYHLPLTYVNQFPQKGGGPLYKGNIYMQVPEGLSQVEIVKFLEIILRLIKNDPQDTTKPNLFLHKASNKYPGKQVISSFNINPHQTTPACLGAGDAEYPIIFHAGDSTADLPFVIGKGFMMGIARTNAVVEALHIQAGEIQQIDMGRLEQAFLAEMRRHADLLWGFTGDVNKKIARESEISKIFSIYKHAFVQCKDPRNLAIIRRGLNSVQSEYAKDLYGKGVHHLKSIADDKTGFNIKNIYFRNHLDQCRNYLDEAYTLSYVLPSDEKKMIEAALLEVAERCKKSAAHYYSLTPPRYNLADQYFNESLEIYEKYFPDSYLEKKLALYSNLITISFLKGESESVLWLAKRVEDTLLPAIDREKYKSVLDKIFYHATLVYIDRAFQLAAVSSFDKDEFKALLSKADGLTGRISSDNAKYSKVLMDKLDELKLKTGPANTSHRM